MNINEEIQGLLEGVELTEESITKLKLMVEKAVQGRTEKLTEELEAAKREVESKESMMEEQVEELVEGRVQKVCEKVDSYANHVVESFIQENKAALIEHAEYEKMKNVVNTIKSAFEEGMFALSEDTAHTELQSRYDEMNEALNEALNDNLELRTKLNEQECAMEFNRLTANLADTQKEKVAKLIENITFDDVQEFTRAVKLVVEEIVTSEDSQKDDNADSNTATVASQPDVDDRMQQYLSRL